MAERSEATRALPEKNRAFAEATNKAFTIKALTIKSAQTERL